MAAEYAARLPGCSLQSMPAVRQSSLGQAPAIIVCCSTQHCVRASTCILSFRDHHVVLFHKVTLPYLCRCIWSSSYILIQAFPLIDCMQSKPPVTLIHSILCACMQTCIVAHNIIILEFSKDRLIFCMARDAVQDRTRPLATLSPTLCCFVTLQRLGFYATCAHTPLHSLRQRIATGKNLVDAIPGARREVVTAPSSDKLTQERRRYSGISAIAIRKIFWKAASGLCNGHLLRGKGTR